jgi:hypothetical protein
MSDGLVVDLDDAVVAGALDGLALGRLHGDELAEFLGRNRDAFDEFG